MTNPNEQPPLPPEMDSPQYDILLRPEDDDEKFVTPPQDKTAPEKAENVVVVQTSDGGCQRGCMYGLTGAVGCLFLLFALLAGAIFVTGQTIGSFVNGFSGLFGSGQPYQIDVSRIYIPQVEKMHQLAELTTVRMNYANIVTVQTDMPALLQGLYGESLVMVAVGHVEAGIDLKQLTQEDVVYNETTNTLTIALPAPTLITCFLNEAQSYVVERSSGVFAATSPTLDADSRRFALQQFREKALHQDEVLAKAETEAQKIIGEFVTLFNEGNAPTIEFITEPPDPNAPLPETCR